jgi:hypothetical protein
MFRQALMQLIHTLLSRAGCLLLLFYTFLCCCFGHGFSRFLLIFVLN